MPMPSTKVAIQTLLLLSVGFSLPCSADTIDAAAIIKAAMDQWRGTTSHYVDDHSPPGLGTHHDHGSLDGRREEIIGPDTETEKRCRQRDAIARQ